MNKNLVALILIVVAGGLYFTITKDILADTKVIKAGNDEVSTAIDNAEDIIRARDTINNQYSSISEEDRDKLDRMIPSSVDNIRLIIDLTAIARSHNIELSGIKASTPSSQASISGQSIRAANVTPVTPSGAITGQQNLTVTDPQLDKVVVTFTAKGTFENFTNFMRDVESSLRIMEFTHLLVKAGETSEFDFDVSIQTYWLRQ